MLKLTSSSLMSPPRMFMPIYETNWSKLPSAERGKRALDAFLLFESHDSWVA